MINETICTADNFILLDNDKKVQILILLIFAIVSMIVTVLILTLYLHFIIFHFFLSSIIFIIMN